MTIFGVDVSHYQATTAAWWKAAKAAGVTFGIAKATEGTTFIDPKFASNIAWMRAAGVIPGAYHFQRPSNGAGQAQLFNRTVGDPNGMLIGLDDEVSMSPADPPAWCAEYSRLHPGHPLLIYTGRDLWPGGDGAHLGPLWAAGIAPNRYSTADGTLAYIWAHSTPAQPAFAGWGSPTIIQFTDKAQVAGIRCDGNAYLGTIDQLRALTGASGDADMPLTQADVDLVVAGLLEHKIPVGKESLSVAQLLTRSYSLDTADDPQPILAALAELKKAVAALQGGGGTTPSGPVNVTGHLDLTPGA